MTLGELMLWPGPPIVPLAAIEALVALAVAVAARETLPVVAMFAAVATVPTVAALAVLIEALVAALPEAAIAISIPVTVAPVALLKTLALLASVAVALLALLMVMALLAVGTIITARLAFTMHARLLLAMAHRVWLRLVARTGVLALLTAFGATLERLAGARERPVARHAATVHAFTPALLYLLLAVGENDAIVVLGMLQVVLG